MRLVVNGLQAGNRSGTGRYVEQLVGHLNPQADEMVRVLWPAEALPPRAHPAVRIHLVTGPGSGARRLLRSLRALARWRQRMGAACLHEPANFVLWPSRAVCVLTIHDLSYFRNPLWFRLDRALYYIAAALWSRLWAAHVIADSEATARDAQRFLRYPATRVHVVHLGVQAGYRPAGPNAIDAVRERYGLPERFFLYVGTLEPRKNLTRLVAAYERIAPEAPQALVLAGRPGWKTERLMRAIETSPVRDRILLPGFIDEADLPALYSAAEAFVYPSLCEGFGLPPLEAMACGTPVLASNASSLPEVVGEAGLLVNPKDTDAIAAAMKRLAHDDALRQQLAEAGKEQAATFTWRRTAEATMTVYRMLAPTSLSD